MKKLILPACLIAIPMIANAAELADTTDLKAGKKLEIVRTTPEIGKVLDKSRPHEPKAIPTPKFVLKSGNNNFLMTIGGSFNFIVGGDIGNDLYKQSDAGISFITSAIPVPAQRGYKGDFYINPINGYMDAQIVAFANSDNELTAYVKAGTNGITSSVALQRAYLTYRGFTGGMKLTLFQDDYACQPPTIDPEGPSGCISTVAYELSYKSKSYNGFRFAIGLDMPTYYSANGYYRGHDYPELDNHQVSTAIDNFIPDVPLWAEYSFSPMNRIRVSGIIRNFRYKDILHDQFKVNTGWGVMLSGNVQPAKQWILYYQFAYGKGIGNYIQDIAGHPYSYIPSDENPGRMTATPMMGANIGVTFNATSKLQFNAMFSEARVFDVRDYANACDEALNYRYALYGAVNCFYNINSFLQVGVEYLYGHRQTWNIGGASDSRIQAQVAFTF